MRCSNNLLSITYFQKQLKVYMRIFRWQPIELSHCLQHLKHHEFKLKIISLHFGFNYFRIYGLRSQHYIVSNGFVSIIFHVNNIVTAWLPMNILSILTFFTSLSNYWLYFSLGVQISHILQIINCYNNFWIFVPFSKSPYISFNFWIKMKFN